MKASLPDTSREALNPGDQPRQRQPADSRFLLVEASTEGVLRRLRHQRIALAGLPDSATDAVLGQSDSGS